MNFDQAFKHIIGVEGQYSNDSRDPGGETKYGISKRSYPGLDIASLTLDEAKRIYKKDYWDAGKCVQIPSEIRLLYFDSLVNCGIHATGRLLQKAINEISKSIGEHPHIIEDGIVGKITQRYAEALANSLKNQFVIERMRYYLAIANRTDVFLLGRMNRLLKIYDAK